MSKVPEIRIKDAWLLRENASQYLHELWGNGAEPTDYKWIAKRVLEYQKAWKPYEQKVLDGMMEATGLEFRQNIIDVYIAPWFNAFSDPLVIGVMSEPDEFIDILTHELIHRLLMDNTTLKHDTELLTRWEKLFDKNMSFGALVHVPVHAVHQYVYLDILEEPKRFKRDLAVNKQNDAVDYTAAWDYVEKHGYKQIIDELMEDYSNGN